MLCSGQCAAVEQYAREHGHRISPAELAATARLSLDYFRRAFVHTYGVTPATWLVRGRIFQSATMLLESNLTIREIADRNGYTDAFQFTRQFKAVMGVSPSVYRTDTSKYASAT